MNDLSDKFDSDYRWVLSDKFDSNYRWVEYFFKLCNVISEKSKDTSSTVLQFMMKQEKKSRNI